MKNILAFWACIFFLFIPVGFIAWFAYANFYHQEQPELTINSNGTWSFFRLDRNNEKWITVRLKVYDPYKWQKQRCLGNLEVQGPTRERPENWIPGEPQEDVFEIRMRGSGPSIFRAALSDGENPPVQHYEIVISGR